MIRLAITLVIAVIVAILIIKKKDTNEYFGGGRGGGGRGGRGRGGGGRGGHWGYRGRWRGLGRNWWPYSLSYYPYDYGYYNYPDIIVEERWIKIGYVKDRQGDTYNLYKFGSTNKYKIANDEIEIPFISDNPLQDGQSIIISDIKYTIYLYNYENYNRWEFDID